MSPFGKIITPLSLLLLTACGISGIQGTIRDHSNDYLEARLGPPLTLPTGLHARTVDQQYEIPALGTQPHLEKPVSIVPPHIFDAQPEGK